MCHKAEDQSERKFVFIMKWRVRGTLEVLVKSLLLWQISIDMWGKSAESLKVHMGGMVLGEELHKEEDSWSWFGFIRQTKGKSLIVPVDVKQKLILCLWEKNKRSR